MTAEKEYWFRHNYRRNLLDMHISDSDEAFLTRFDAAAYADALKEAGVQAAMVKAKSHTGLCYWPAGIGRMHRGLGGKDLFGATVRECHQRGIAVIAYYSQIFDNWAYDAYPEWRLVCPDGKSFRDYRGMGWFRSGRYGIMCPNQPGYRDYVKKNLAELCERYDFEGIFLDMTFWPGICVCPVCREKYRRETGAGIPETVDFNDPSFLRFQARREEWLWEFAEEMRSAVKAARADVTVEHQFSMITSPWVNASTELLADAVDYCGGDYYGGYLQQTFINKYYRSVSPALPFVYHTSRCEPELRYHTTTKTEEQLILHVITALIHDGAFLLVDAIDPDGRFNEKVYRGLMKKVYAVTKPFEEYAGGRPLADAAILFPSRAKYDPREGPFAISCDPYGGDEYLSAKLKMAGILRESHIPFDVIPSRRLSSPGCRLLILSFVPRLSDEEMERIGQFVRDGGKLYVSGPVGHPLLEEMLGIRCGGWTDERFTYMTPAFEGALPGFDGTSPLTVDGPQLNAELRTEDACVEAVQTLPWVRSGTEQFAAIHSDPPGRPGTAPAVVRRKVGKGEVLWTAACLEKERPYMSRLAVRHLIRSLKGEGDLECEAPGRVEVLRWVKEGREYLAFVNEQEEMPVSPACDITLSLKGEKKRLRELPAGGILSGRSVDGRTYFEIDRVRLFRIFHVLGPDEND